MANKDDYWGTAADMVPWFANGNTGAEYWSFDSPVPLMDPRSMMVSEFAGNDMESVFDYGAAASLLEQEEARIALPAPTSGPPAIPEAEPNMTVALSFGTAEVTIALPESYREMVQAQLGALGTELAMTAEEAWGKILTEGDTDEFVWWPQLADSTVKQKERQGLSPDEARRPNWRGGDMAKMLTQHRFGPPTLVEDANGPLVVWGPKFAEYQSKEAMKYKEAFFGAGPNTPNPASGRGHHTIRPARNFGFVPSMREPFTQIIRNWIADIDQLQKQFSGKASGPTTITWKI